MKKLYIIAICSIALSNSLFSFLYASTASTTTTTTTTEIAPAPPEPITLPYTIKGIKWNHQGDLLAVRVKKSEDEDGVFVYEGGERKIDLNIREKVADIAWSKNSSCLAVAAYTSPEDDLFYSANRIYLFTRNDILTPIPVTTHDEDDSSESHSETRKISASILLYPTTHRMNVLSFLDDATLAIGYGRKSYYNRSDPAIQIIRMNSGPMNGAFAQRPTTKKISISSIAQYFKTKLGADKTQKHFLGILSIVYNNGLLATEGYLFDNKHSPNNHPLELVWRMTPDLTCTIADDLIQKSDFWNNQIALTAMCPETGTKLYKHALEEGQVRSKVELYRGNKKTISLQFITKYAKRPNGQFVFASVRKYTTTDRFGNIALPWKRLPISRRGKKRLCVAASDQETTFAYNRVIYRVPELPRPILHQLRHRQLTGKFAPRTLLKRQSSLQAHKPKTTTPTEDQTDSGSAEMILTDLPSILQRRQRTEGDSLEEDKEDDEQDFKRTRISTLDDLEKI